MQISFTSPPPRDTGYDVAIIGGGPAGATCAAFCASAGLRTLLLERETFPREKVCGDCLNPSAWPVLSRLGVDGRNSTVARLLGMLPAASKDRVALQTHFPAPADFVDRVAMRFLPWGYSGLASVGEGMLNLCLVARPKDIGTLKAWACAHFQ